MPLDKKNLRRRVVSAAVIAPLALLGVYCGGWIYGGATLGVSLLGLREWWHMTTLKANRSIAVRTGWIALGFGYIGSFCLALLYLRALPDIGMGLVYYLFAVVWGTDIGAYAAGRLIGGPKLMPAISPNKTWAGLLGGMALAAVGGYGAAVAFDARLVSAGIGLALLLAVVSQLGDLFESLVKRRAGVKESGHLIPGHGGILDRIDGLIFAAIFFALFQITVGVRMQWW